MPLFELPPIYPITDRELSGLGHAEQIRQLAEAGCRFVQIREKSASSRDFYDSVVESQTIARKFGIRLIVNDRVDIAIAGGTDGVHLGQDDLSPVVARNLLGDDAIIGYSTHSVEQAIAAAAMPVNYIAVGPIFATSTKENPDPVIGLNGIKAIRAALGSTQIVAIGGITLENVTEVIAAGTDSAAIISGLYRDPERIGVRYREFLDSAFIVKHD
jgi:thiamine-phosphate pyrophosphorylase